MAAPGKLTRALLANAAIRHPSSARRSYAVVSVTPARHAHHHVVIVGGGTAGLTVAAQLMRDTRLEKKDIAIVDAAKEHHYQPGWTLVGSGLGPPKAYARPQKSVMPPGVTHHPLHVTALDPDRNVVRTVEGVELLYDYLVVAPGLQTNVGGVTGLSEALRDPTSRVSTIYSADTAQQVWRNIQATKRGKAIFTQPAGIIKCAGAPQKIMWMALSQWQRNGVRESIDMTFATGAASMFAVAKYSRALDHLRQERKVEALFQHNLVKVDAKKRVATFRNLAADGHEVERPYDFLHVVPPQKPWDWLAQSRLADSAGWVDVHKHTTQHNKYPNVFSLGDASSLPNSKTAAAITAQAPVLVHNLLQAMSGKPLKAEYDGYASCPLLTGHNELMLCEFKYGGEPKETFAPYPLVGGDQAKPSRLFYHIKKHVFPFVYWNHFVKGTWYGPRTLFKPRYDTT